MSSMERCPGRATLSVRNVGGISSTEVDLRPGVTVLEGRNATNRTSLLQAIAAAMGSDQATLKGDAEDGEVRLEIGDETYTRTFSRSGQTVTTGGDPYLADAQVADLFAFLFGGNEARRAVVGGEDLREIIMRPIDTEALQAEIERLKRERERVDDEIGALDDLAEELPALERRRERLTDQVAEKREELETARAAVEDLDVDPEDRRERQAELDERTSDLNERRSDLEDVRFRIEAEEESLSSLRSEREELEAELDDLPELPAGELNEVESELSRLRDRKRSLESTINRLHGIVEFNEEMLSGDGPDAIEELGGQDRSVVEELLADEERTVVCWTCGSEVERAAIDETLERIRNLRADLQDERGEISSRVSELKDRQSELRSARDRRERLTDRLDRVEAEIAEREADLETLQEREANLEDTIDDLESEVETLRDEEEDDEILERQREVSQLEFELERLEDELAEVEAEIAEVEERLDDRERLEERREAVAEDLAEQRKRVDRVEREAVEAFNDHMDNLLSILEYENVDRVWIERTEVERREGRRTVQTREFDLHVVRTGDDGAAYEDTIDTLSESEREVVGLVFALAGYLAHDVNEEVPFVLLDSLEAIDAGRIAELVDYFSSQADFLVVALLPEDADPIDSDHRVTEI